jgi:hypothetical protein
VDSLAPAEDEQRHPSHHLPLQLAFYELVQRGQGVPTHREAVRNILAVVYTGGQTICEVAAKETGGRNRSKSQIPQQLASLLPPTGAFHQRRDIETSGGEVPRGVDQAHALLLLVKFRPIGETGDGGRNRGDGPHANQYAGRPVASGYSIQNGGRCPRPHRYLDTERVNRMS